MFVVVVCSLLDESSIFSLTSVALSLIVVSTILESSAKAGLVNPKTESVMALATIVFFTKLFSYLNFL